MSKALLAFGNDTSHLRLSTYIMGGIGNQLFQYAAGFTLARYWNRELELDVRQARTQWSAEHPRSYQLDQFTLSCQRRTTGFLYRIATSRNGHFAQCAKLLRRILSVDIVDEEIGNEDFAISLPNRMSSARLVSLKGYWQRCRWVEEFEKEIRNEFRFRRPAIGPNLEMLNRIVASECAISVHIRRGDYLKIQPSWVLSFEYYEKAILEMGRRLSDCVRNMTFFIFSDEIAWCKCEFREMVQRLGKLGKQVSLEFVDVNNEFNPVEDLRLMSVCHHHIMSNSTFSWWGAWLNESCSKIVLGPTPANTRKDLYPLGWSPISIGK